MTDRYWKENPCDEGCGEIHASWREDLGTPAPAMNAMVTVGVGLSCPRPHPTQRNTYRQRSTETNSASTTPNARAVSIERCRSRIESYLLMS